MSELQDISDHALILQYREGNTSVLPELVKRYHQVFCQKAYWITKDRDSAKDVAQESWITIIGKIDSLKNVSSFKSWALRIVYTKAIDIVKLRNKEHRTLENVSISTNGTSANEDQNLLILKTLLNEIQKLPKEKQDVIRLFYAEDYTIIEISKFLNIPVGTVKSRLFKAREKLKKIKNTYHEK